LYPGLIVTDHRIILMDGGSQVNGRR
jgi:hypothetical protein